MDPAAVRVLIDRYGRVIRDVRHSKTTIAEMEWTDEPRGFSIEFGRRASSDG